MTGSKPVKRTTRNHATDLLVQEILEHKNALKTLADLDAEHVFNLAVSVKHRTEKISHLEEALAILNAATLKEIVR